MPTEQEVRESLGKRLRLDDEEMAWLWERLPDHDPLAVEAAVHGGGVELDELLATARRLVGMARSWPGSQRASRRSADDESAQAATSGRQREHNANIPVVLSAVNGYEGQRWIAVTKALGIDAAMQEPVRRFRDHITGGLLMPESARAFVASPAAAVFTPANFMEASIPFVGHAATIEDVEHRDGVARVAIHVTPPGTTLRAEFHGVESLDRLDSAPSSRADGGWDHFAIWPKSVLDEYLAVGKWLAERYLWPERDACWFVLNGVPPAVAPVRVSGRMTGHANLPRGVINLEVEPWVSAPTVEAIYRALQRRALGGTNHRISERNMAVFEYVLGWIDPEHGTMPPFRWMATKWNEGVRNKKWKYAPERLDEFGRDFHRARKALLTPRYPGLPPAEETGPGPQ